jgi:hypothetical protein
MRPISQRDAASPPKWTHYLPWLRFRITSRLTLFVYRYIDTVDCVQVTMRSIAQQTDPEWIEINVLCLSSVPLYRLLAFSGRVWMSELHTPHNNRYYRKWSSCQPAVWNTEDRARQFPANMWFSFMWIMEPSKEFDVAHSVITTHMEHTRTAARHCGMH